MRRVLCVRIKVLTTAKDTSAYFAKEEEVMNVTAVAVCHRARAISAITDMWTAPAKAGLYTITLPIPVSWGEKPEERPEVQAQAAAVPAAIVKKDMWSVLFAKAAEDSEATLWEDLTERTA